GSAERVVAGRQQSQCLLEERDEAIVDDSRLRPLPLAPTRERGFGEETRVAEGPGDRRGLVERERRSVMIPDTHRARPKTRSSSARGRRSAVASGSSTAKARS